MERFSFSVRVARFLQTIPLRLLIFLERPFIALEDRHVNKTKALFLLALPRSGSTVTYQVICHGLRVQYLSNLWNLLYQLPLLGGYISSFMALKHRSDFRSNHGFVAKLGGPAEGLRFWQWWLGCGLSDSDCKPFVSGRSGSRSHYLRSVLNVLTRRAGPFATAYLGHTLIPDYVYDTFPGAVLIRLRRDPVSNALSLLKAMRNSNRRWFSVLPKECEALFSASEHERVAAQVYWLNRRLDGAACANRMLTVHYEKLCENPTKELDRIRAWCQVNEIDVGFKFLLPEQFKCDFADLKGDSDAIRIRQALNDLEKAHGKLESAP